MQDLHEPVLARPGDDAPARIGPVRRFGRWLLAAIILILVLFIYWKYFFTYSEGNRTGLLQKFSYRGTLFKTYEGELILSSIRSQQQVTIASEKFHFSVTDRVTARALENLQGRYVTVHYIMKNGVLPWRGDSRYLVDSVRLEQGP